MTDYSNTPVSVANLKHFLGIGNKLEEFRPGVATNISLTSGDQQIIIKWTDTTTYAQDSSLAATWSKTIVRRQTGSAPAGPDDGTAVVTESGTKNQYQTNGFIDTGLTNGTTYYYGIFTFNNYGAFSSTTVSAIAGYDDRYKPGAVTNLTAKKGNGNAKISWTDTNTITTDNSVSSGISWTSATLVRKIGSAPTSINDGTIVLTSTTKNQYSSTPYTDSNLTNGTTYYYAVFTTNSVGKISDATSVSVTPVASRTMTVIINTADSNPDTCCTYADDAVGMTAKSDEWDEFFGHYPVLLTAAGVETPLNPDDFTKTATGASADITSGSAGDVMIVFPRRDIKITTSGSNITVSMTDDLGASGYTHYAHQKGSTDKDKFYYGAYLGYNMSSVGRSLSGKTPTANITLTNARTYTKSRSNWYLAGFYQRLYLQVMYLLKYKSLNGQTALGRGFVDGNSAVYGATGSTNTKGMDWGETTGKYPMKIFGIEDFWGNLYQWCDGCYNSSSRYLLTSHDPANFNDTGSNYTQQHQMSTSNTGNYMNKVAGTSEGGFTPIGGNFSGSATTYWSDYGRSSASCCVVVGGAWNYAGSAGPFCFDAYFAASASNTYVGFRTMYI